MYLRLPQPQVERLIRDLRRFYGEPKQFPHNFHEVNERLWHTKPNPDYGVDGKQARVKSYVYRYTRVEAGKCVLWALPVGPQRQTALSYFLVISAEWARMWQGESLVEAQLVQLSAIPTPRELNELQMREVLSKPTGK